MKPALAKIETLTETGAITSLTIARTNLLGYLPLHCMPLSEGSPLCLAVPTSYEIAANSPVSIPAGLSCSNVLIVADPEDNLPFARAEAATIAAIFPNSTVLIGEDATKGNVLRKLGQGEAYSHIHFATHGRFHWSEGDADGIVLRDREILSAREIEKDAHLKPGAVVILAACETWLSDVWENGFDPASLARAFLERGASTVLASTWPLSDFATSRLVTNVFEALKQQLSPTTALKTAQIEMRAGSTSRNGGSFRWTNLDTDDVRPNKRGWFDWAGLAAFSARAT